MNITVAGVGYVGLAQAVLLAQHNAVTAVTTTPAKAENINRGVSPIVDAEITDFLRTKPLTLTATVDAEQAYRTADVVIIATPTDYDPDRHLFNTSTVEAVLSLVGRVNPGALVVIKSTVPVGYTERIVGRFGCERLLFSPEFLREGKALYDNLHPSRIVVGRPRGGQHRRCGGDTRRTAQDKPAENHAAASLEALMGRPSLIHMIQPHICDGKMHTAILPLMEVFHAACLPFAVEQLQCLHERLVNAHFRRVDIRTEGFLPFRAEKVSHLLVHQRFQLFLCPAAETARTADPAEKQHRHKDRPEQCSLHRKKANGTAHCADQPHQKPGGRLPLEAAEPLCQLRIRHASGIRRGKSAAFFVHRRTALSRRDRKTGSCRDLRYRYP